MKEKDIKNSDHSFNGLNENERDSSAGINSDESMSGTTYLNDQLEDDNEKEKLTAELQEQKDKYLRLVAEFDNYRKRTAKERIELIQTAGREVISSLLDVLDDAERAEKQLQNTSDVPKALEGVQLVFNKLRSVLQSKGLKQMESAHTDFDEIANQLKIELVKQLAQIQYFSMEKLLELRYNKILAIGV